MPALELITYGYTACPAAETEFPLVAGDSGVIRNFDNSKKAHILGIFPLVQSAGTIRVKSSRLHDNVDNVRFDYGADQFTPIIMNPPQPVLPQDEIVVTGNLTTGAGDIDLVQALIYYDDLAGSNGNFITFSDLKAKAKNWLTIYQSLTVGATFAWSGTQAINADSDLLKANTNYAVLGFTQIVHGLSVAIKGSDTGNLRVGFPYYSSTAKPYGLCFRDMAEFFGLPLIPVINSANKGNTFIECIGNETTSGAVLFNIILAELT